MGLLVDNIRKASEGRPYNVEYGERVSIDPERVRKARDIQKEAKERGLAPTLACMTTQLIRNIELMLITEGQHDPQFKLGDFIKYTPSEVAEILRKHANELLT